MRTIFLLSALLWAATAFSQALSFTNSIYFEVDKADISETSATVLKKMAEELATAADYEIQINAYTDNAGTAAYNEQLANSRGLSVQEYLAQQGVITGKTVVKGWGEQQQNNQTEEGRRKNRRVDLLVTTFTIDGATAFYNRMSANTRQTFLANTEQEQRFTAANGTVLIIPPHAFEDENGNPVTGMVDIDLREALQPADWIANQLSTTSKEALLQTGGMAYVAASQNGRPLQLAADAALTIGIPAKKDPDPDMRLFYGNHSDGDTTGTNNIVTWNAAENDQAFRNVFEKDEYSRTLDNVLAQALQKMRVEVPAKPAMPSFGEMAKMPRLPVAPNKPRMKSTKPIKEEVYKAFTRDGQISKKQAKRAHEEYMRRYDFYLKDSAICVQNAEKYNAQYNLYLADLETYEQKKAVWETESARRVNAYQSFRDTYFKHYYASCLNTVLQKAGKTSKPMRFVRLNKSVEARAFRAAEKLWKKDKQVLKAQEEANLLKLGMSLQKMQQQQKANPTGDPNWFRTTCLEDTDCRLEHIAKLSAGCGLAALSDSLWAIDADKRINAGSNEKKNIKMSLYITEITQMGWINVDRFYKSQAPLVRITYDQPEAFALYAHFPELRGMIALRRSADGMFDASGIPQGQQMELIAFKTKDGKVWMSRQKLKAGLGKPAFNYQPHSLMDIKKSLATL